MNAVQGACDLITCYDGAANTAIVNELRSWAQSVHWEMTGYNYISFKRKEEEGQDQEQITNKDDLNSADGHVDQDEDKYH